MVIVHIEMLEIDGLTLTSMIAETFPDIKVIIYGSHEEEEYLRKALIEGAKGYLIKDTPTEEIADAIRFINKGYIQLDMGLFKKMTRGLAYMLILFAGVLIPWVSISSPVKVGK